MIRIIMCAFTISALLPLPLRAEPHVIEKGKQPTLQDFLTRHKILAAPSASAKDSIVPLYAKDYNDVSAFPAHDRIWSFERGGYVLKTSGHQND